MNAPHSIYSFYTKTADAKTSAVFCALTHSFRHIGCALLGVRDVRVGHIAGMVQVHLLADGDVALPERSEVIRGIIAAGATAGDDHGRRNPPERNLFSVGLASHSDVHLPYTV